MRIGLVLGAGGVVGHAFHVGVLAAIAESTGWDAREAEVVVGTSAGSIVGALLRGGLSPADLYARATGAPLSPEGAATAAMMGTSAAPVADGGPWRLPHLPAGRVLARAAIRPFDGGLGALLASILPEGRISTEHIAAGFRRLHASRWPERPLWLVAVGLRDGERVVFGRDAHADVASAVAASCAIPGYYRPVEIDGARYVDGGAHSLTNLDLLAGAGLDLVLVSSPMSAVVIALTPDAPGRAYAKARLRFEELVVRRRGTPVVSVEPADIDLVLAGLRAMDPSRREPVARRAYETTLRRLADGDLRERLAALV